MVSVVIRHGEPNVVKYTFELLYKELKDIPGSELLVKDWSVEHIKNKFVCFVEADCLVSPNYFKEQIEAFSKLSPRVIVLSPTTGVKYWDNKIYGYRLSPDFDSTVLPIRKPKTTYAPYPVQIGYIPGSIIRTSSLKRIIKNLRIDGLENDLIYYSSMVSLGIWNQGITSSPKHKEGQLGTQIYVNPNVSYCTTEDYVNDVGRYDETFDDRLITLFNRESI